MSIQIPAEAAVITESRLTLIHVVKTIHGGISKKGGLIDQVKAAMAKKKSPYAQSDHVTAMLKDGYPRSTIDPHKAFTAFIAKGIAPEKFFSCCTVGKEAVREHLSENEIAAISSAGEASPPSLVTEFKPYLTVEPEALTDAMAIPLVKHLGKLGKAA